MVSAVRGFSGSRQNGLFINSCFAHCQSERQDTWFADDSPVIDNKVGFWVVCFSCKVILIVVLNLCSRWRLLLAIGTWIELLSRLSTVLTLAIQPATIWYSND